MTFCVSRGATIHCAIKRAAHLALADADTRDAADGLEAELGEELARLLLRARLLAGAVDLLAEAGRLRHLKIN